MRKLIPLAVILLFSCNVAKREVAKMEVYAVRYPNDFKILANTLNPCFNGKAKSDTILKHDTTITAGSTTIENVFRHDTAFITKTIRLPGQTITNTITVHDTVTNDREEGALQATIRSVQDSLTIVKTQLKIKSHQADVRLWWLIGLAVAGLIAIGVKVYSFFSGGAVTGIIKKL